MHRILDTNRLRKLREARGWSQEHLAAVAGISLATIQRAESGRPVSPEKLQALAAAFDTQTADLLPSPASPAPIPSATLLRRMRSGKELSAVVGGADAFQNDYDVPADQTQVELIGTFLQESQDLGELWDELEPSNRVQAAHNLGESLKIVEDAGYCVFAGRVSQAFRFGFDPSKPIRLSVSVVLLLRLGNPRITLPGTKEEYVATVFGDQPDNALHPSGAAVS